MTKPKDASRTRTTKTPKQRAQEAHDVAERAVKRLAAKHAALVDEAAAVDDELQVARRRLAYLASNPDLSDDVELPLTDEAKP